MLSNTYPFFALVIGFYALSFIDIIPLKIKRNQLLFLKIFAILLLIIFAGCRWSPFEVGVEVDIFDYETYKKIYNAPLNLSNFYHDYLNSDVKIRTTEIGYILYSTIMYNIIGDNYNIFLLTTNAILIYLLLRSFKVNGISSGFFFLAFFYLSRLYFQYNFIIMRQAIALMIVWYAFHFLIIESNKKFYITTIIASLFHTTALIVLLTPFLLKIRIKRYIFISICIIIFFCNIFKITDVFITNCIESTLSLFGQEGIGRFVKYIMLDEKRGMNLLNFIEAIPFIWIVIKYKKELNTTSAGKIYAKMVYIFIFFLIITMNFGFLTRISQYFMFSYIYILYFFIANVESKNKRLFLFLLSIYLLTYICRYIMIWFYGTPYSFFLLHE